LLNHKLQSFYLITDITENKHFSYKMPFNT